ncbi:MAG: hypothetical protein PWP49_1253 [Thermococcaceae archaeon]|jgi:hypothetical protein|uniref:hypothetical protein n=1 Tax=Thermococcus TaxID=2263 RepID=UPI0005B26EA2|nr:MULTISPECIES: hypothetical protein [Thermococcus]KUJ98960.1 MAG: Uncharacterized protein XD43_1378 [Thermococcales archaeon 44_46]MCA6212765.1 hypothetical protein [Thermococcus bergensis]MDN5320833.1 hypothetical protein [Thermococcaceae archaeon]HIH73565.1 hypothetical protein [Thermococcaceae archaeon]
MKVYRNDREYPPEYREVLEELSTVIDPISTMNILDAGLLAGLEVGDDTLKLWLAVESNSYYNMIGGAAIAHSKIIGDIMERFALVKFSRVYIYDMKNNLLAKFEKK